MDELLEVISWSYLGIHSKPIGILNVNHFFDSFIAFVDKSIEEGFMSSEMRDIFVIADTPEGVLTNVLAYRPPAFRRVLDDRTDVR